ncbi:FitA-like ribbon-helix-helix domain-containing protein [Synechococcus sp. A10-1-5-9]|uniref:FitA-like ribbon-helix-helix domain-containing protein n=1 Tax=Synechococcus sp. A10-1-5-9 TaxID=3392295 RepID=UPI0039EB3A0F
MPSLQIRDLPAPLHEDLQRRARANKRSLGQQALHDLEQLAGGDAIERRKQVFASLNSLWDGKSPMTLTPSPEELIRSDRER